jgi:hypothetical protein
VIIDRRGREEEVCDRCGHAFPSCLVLDTAEGLLCLNCRRALGEEAEDAETEDDDEPQAGA